MKLSSSIRRSVDDKLFPERQVDESECAPDLERLLDWARLKACHACRHPSGIKKYHKILKESGETDRRLQELDQWSESVHFTGREKAVLGLSEAMAMQESEDVSPDALTEAKRHFNRTEMIRLTLGILAINEWIKATAHPPAHILVVEDDPKDRELLAWQLNKAHLGDHVIFVPDARHALAVLEDYRNGTRDGELIALFLDLRLPGMSGIELLRHIRTMPDTEDLPVIVMTSSRDPRHVEECQNLKVVSYVEKPVTWASFSNTIAHIVHSAQMA